MKRTKIAALFFVFGLTGGFCMQDGRGLYPEDVDSIVLINQTKTNPATTGLVMGSNIWAGYQAADGSPYHGGRTWRKYGTGKYDILKSDIGIPVGLRNIVIVASTPSYTQIVSADSTVDKLIINIRDESLAIDVDSEFSWIAIY